MVNWSTWKFKPQLYFGGKLALVRSLPKLTNPVDITLIFSTILFHWKSLKAEGIISPGVLLSRGGGVLVCTITWTFCSINQESARIILDYKKQESLSLSQRTNQKSDGNFVCSSMSHKERLSTSKSKRFWLMFTNRNIGFVGSRIRIKF